MHVRRRTWGLLLSIYSRRQLLAKAAIAARRLIAVRWRAARMVREYQRPHPRRSYGRGVGLEDAADNSTVGKHVEIVLIPFAGRARRRRAFKD
jgi:hypothetical protein